MTVPFATAQPGRRLRRAGTRRLGDPLPAAGPGRQHGPLHAAPGRVSLAVTHRTVTSSGMCSRARRALATSGRAATRWWRCYPHTAHSIPLGTDFQFRNPGPEPADLVIVTMPPWPGMDEAVRVADYWPQPAPDTAP